MTGMVMKRLFKLVHGKMIIWISFQTAIKKSLNVSCSDSVLCKEVLGQDSGAFAVLNELLRSLKKGGTLLTTAPFAFLPHFTP